MKNYKQMVEKSRFADFKDCKKDMKEDYRCSFLQGTYYMTRRLEDSTFHINPDDYEDVPSFLKIEGEKVRCAFRIEPVSYIEDQPSHYNVNMTVFEDDDVAYEMDIDEDELKVEEARDLFAFVFCALDDGRYKDIDEYYGYELS